MKSQKKAPAKPVKASRKIRTSGPQEIAKKTAEMPAPGQPVITTGFPVVGLGASAGGLAAFEALAPEATRTLLHELRGHQIEREMQNEELRRTQVEMDVSRARYFDLYDRAPVGYVTLSEAGLIRQANFTAATLLGVTQTDLVQQPLARFIQKEDADNYYLLRKQLLATGEPQSCELQLVKSDGTLFPALLVAITAPDESGAPIFHLTLSDIEEREKSKKELREKEERLSLATLHNGVGIWDWNLITQKLVWDDSMFALYHIRREDFIGTKEAWRASLHPGDLARGDQEVTDAISGKKPFDTEFRVVWPNGEIHHIKAVAKVFRDGQGIPLRMLGTNWDITARKQAEAALRESEERYRSIVQTSEEGIWTMDATARTDFVNPKMVQMLGYPVEEMLGRHLEAFMDEEGRAISTNNVKRRQPGIAEQHEFKFRRKDGSALWTSMATSPITNGSGEYGGALAMVTDITARKQAEQLLAWENSALEMIGSAAPLHEVLDGLMLGLEKQLAGALCSVLLLDDDGIHLRHGAAPSLPETYNRVIDGVAIGPTVGSCGTAAYARRQVIIPDIGSDPLWADFRELALGHGLLACWSTPIQGNKEKVLGTFAIYYREIHHPASADLELIARAVHITRIAIERKQTEEALRDANQKLRLHFEQTPMAVIEWDLDFRVTRWNPAAETVFGYRCAEALGQHASFIVPEAFRSQVDQIWQSLMQQSGGERSTNGNVCKDGTTILGEWYNTPLIDERGVCTGVASLVQDVTERKQTEEKIHQLNAELEQRVAERTHALHATNAKLQNHTLLLERANHELRLNEFSVQHASLPLCWVDANARIMRVNHAFVDLTGYAEPQALDLELFQVASGYPAAEWAGHWRQLRKGKALRLEWNVCRKDGGLVPVAVDLNHLKFERQEYGFICLHDVSATKQVAAERRERARSLAEARDAERSRFALDLHDHIAQHLAALKLNIEIMDKQVKRPKAERQQLHQMLKLVGELLTSVRQMAWQIYPPVLGERGLDEALRHACGEWSEQNGVVATYGSEGLDHRRLPLHIETPLFRIAQEALTNVARHASASQVSVLLQKRGQTLSLIVEDNGKGFHVQRALAAAIARRRLGVLGMHERAEMTGATLNIESRPGQGTTVFIRLALPDAATAKHDCAR